MSDSVKSIRKIVITGGPCAGKTAAMSRIKSEFEKMGYTVLIIAETATELITGGIASWTCSSVYEYQLLQAKLQIEKEEIFYSAALNMQGKKILIFCDRGLLDNKAYLTNDEYLKLLKDLNTDESQITDRYDAVFHLCTTAKGAENFYTVSNNSARTETPQQAIVIDDKIISVWKEHPYFRIIDNTTDFSGKIQRLIAEIFTFIDCNTS